METTQTTIQGAALRRPPGPTIRDAVRRELEAELRRLLMAVRMQGFRLVLEDSGPRADDWSILIVSTGSLRRYDKDE